MKTYLYFVFAFWLCLSVCQGADPEEISRKLAVVLAASRDNYGQLKSFVVKAKGELFSADDRLGDLSGPLEITIARDFEHDLFRFERTEPYRIPINRRAPLQNGNWEVKPHVSRWIHGPDKEGYAVGDAAGTGIVVVSVGDPRAVKATRPFDVRVIGFGTWFSLENFRSFEDVLSSFSKYPFTDVKIVDGGRLLMFEVSGGGERTNNWFDSRQGSLPVRTEITLGERVVFQSETTWQKHGDIWLPSTHTFTNRNASLDEPARDYRYDLSFEWNNVNSPLDPGLFDVRTLRDTPIKVVTDIGGAEPIILEKIYAPGHEPPAK